MLLPSDSISRMLSGSATRDIVFPNNWILQEPWNPAQGRCPDFPEKCCAKFRLRFSESNQRLAPDKLTFSPFGA